ncbi:MAG: diguanylate cyclase [Pirellulaceae bacterium]|nr:diguanylate cyclase [Pirellulaceae bacterium]
MPDTQAHNTPGDWVAPVPERETPAMPETWTSQLDAILEELQELTQSIPVAPIVDREIDNRLIQVRLGIASSLFTALRYKHPPTAAHALRVALGCSAWCIQLGVDSEERDKIEIAALLHDLGAIGIPDRILQKPGLLDVDEATIIERSRHMSVEILRACCAEPAILSMVENVPARYDGTRLDYHVLGNDIPFGARMIAIVESFDSMTNEQIFRPAMSREAAMTELFACAGSQFDPELVARFADFCCHDQVAARQETSCRWLRTLDPRAIERYWRLHHAPVPSGQLDRKRIFETRLLDNMYDAVIFVDSQMTIQLWNSGTERMTGILSKSVCHQQWQPELLNMRDEKGDVVEPDGCPVSCSMRSGVQSLRRLVIWGRNGRPISVDTHVIPVMDEAGKTLGAVLVLHDASSEISLERRCQSLHDEAITDPLTRVANRAEFDRVHDMFVKAHSQRRLPCSLVICDLDRFKQVNDVYGHQAGDDVIQTLASLLKDSCRSGDLVARYGGEEFVMLYTDCDNATAARRTEEVRFAMSRIPHRRMGGRGVTASFGVTEIQPGDTPETMLRRADRALLMAKSRGRNMVVQLGTGSAAGTRSLEGDVPMALSHVGHDGTRIEHDLFTSVPIAVAVEKLRGFIADHRARILEADHNRLRLQIEHTATGPRRRRNDRVMSFSMELELDEGLADDTLDGAEPGTIPAGRIVSGTRVRAVISPVSKRDRRADDVVRRSREVLLSLRSYLMAVHEQSDPLEEDGILAEDDVAPREVDLRQFQALRPRSMTRWLRQVFRRRPGPRAN